MKARILVACMCIPLLLVIFFVFPPIATALLLSVMSALAAYELLHPTGYAANTGVLICSIIMAALVPLVCYVADAGLIGGRQLFVLCLALLFIFFLLLQAFLLVSHTRLPFQSLSLGFYASLIIPFLLSSLLRILQGQDGRYYILVPIAIAFVADAAALFTGMYFGKHKLAPVISPKKTVEGVIGGIVGAIAAMGIYCLVVSFAFNKTPNVISAMLYAVAGSGTSVMGDLCFSVIKRQTGIKDFGTILPGHGGILDRFDSMIFTAPLIELLIFLLPIY